MNASKLVELAAITGAHGVAGEVRLKLFGEGIAELSRYTRFNKGSLTLKAVRPGPKGTAVARFAEVGDRTAAERLRGTVLTISREDLPPLEQGEFYHSDLLGLPVVTDSGDAVGKVHAVENFGATDILEILKPDGRKFMVPLTQQAVPEWDGDRVVVSNEFVD